MRCVVYSGDVFVWVGAVAPALRVAIWALIGPDSSEQWEGRMRLIAAGTGLMTVAAGYKLAVAYRRYVQFQHPLATVIASQLVVVMSIAAALGFLTREWFWLFL